MTMALQTGVVYGPLRSRRFGSSLGVNLLPARQKLCTYSCGYCQYAETPSTGRVEWPTLQEIERRLDESLRALRRRDARVDWIVFCGNGEPTLHPRFAEAVERVCRLREEHYPLTPVGILSNSSTCGQERVRQGLRRLDGCFLKLDAGSQAVFERVNRPHDPNRSFAELVDDLSRVSAEVTVTLQSLFLTGAADNTTDAAVREWIGALARIRPAAAHLYTIDRQPQDAALRPAARGRLRAIAAQAARKTGVPCSVY